MRTRFTTCLLLLCLLTGGCGNDSSIVNVVTPGETVEKSFSHDGIVRSYLIHVPETYDDDVEVPLLLVLHGYSSAPEFAESGSGLSALVEAEGFIVVYPRANGSPTMWNAGGPFESWSGGVDDVGFISSLIDHLIDRYAIDPARVYVTGHSNGGFMTYLLFSALADKIAGIAPMAGLVIEMPYPQPARRIPIIHFHAIDDPAVQYRGQYFGSYKCHSAIAGLSYWTERFGHETVPDTIYNANDVLGLRWPSPDGKSDFVLYTTPRGRHEWLNQENSGLSANEVMWAFFQK